MIDISITYYQNHNKKDISLLYSANNHFNPNEMVKPGAANVEDMLIKRLNTFSSKTNCKYEKKYDEL